MIGNYRNKLDIKGRLIIPIKFRDEFNGTVIVSLGLDQTLEIRNSEAFTAWTNQIQAKGMLSKEARIISRAILGNSFELNIDNQGRINLPQSLILKANIRGEVVLVGVRNKVEVHSLEAWNAFMNETADGILEQAAAKLSNDI